MFYSVGEGLKTRLRGNIWTRSVKTNCAREGQGVLTILWGKKPLHGDAEKREPGGVSQACRTHHTKLKQKTYEISASKRRNAERGGASRKKLSKACSNGEKRERGKNNVSFFQQN